MLITEKIKLIIVSFSLGNIMFPKAKPNPVVTVRINTQDMNDDS